MYLYLLSTPVNSTSLMTLSWCSTMRVSTTRKTRSFTRTRINSNESWRPGGSRFAMWLSRAEPRSAKGTSKCCVFPSFCLWLCDLSKTTWEFSGSQILKYLVLLVTFYELLNGKNMWQFTEQSSFSSLAGIIEHPLYLAHLLVYHISRLFSIISWEIFYYISLNIFTFTRISVQLIKHYMYDSISFYNIAIGILFSKCHKIKKNALILNVPNSSVTCVIPVYTILYSNYPPHLSALPSDVSFFWLWVLCAN